MKRKTKNIKAKSKPQPKTKAANQDKELHPLAYEIIGLLLITFAIIEFFEFGIIGRWTFSIAVFFFGNLHFIVPILCFLIAGMLMVRRRGVAFNNRIVSGVLLVGASLTIFSHSLLFEQMYAANSLISNSVLKETWRILISTEGIVNRSHALGGGMIGGLLFSVLHVLFDATGAKIAATVILAIGIILITGKAFVPLLIEKAPKLKGMLRKPGRNANSRPVRENRSRRTQQQQLAEEAAAEEHVVIMNAPVQEEPVISNFVENIRNEQMREPNTEEEDDTLEEVNVPNAASEQSYILPPITILNAPPEQDQSGEYSIIQQNAKKLEQTFLSFGVKAKVTQVHLGPAVTKYEV
ncbi:MAG: DNA translocase FtsK, partial [Solibacillus sp.]